MKPTRNLPIRHLFALFALSLSLNLFAQSAEKTEFGPYVALTRDSNIVKDVKVEENGRIYLLLNPDFKEKAITLKNSSGNKSGYRKWHNGEFELISPANQGKAPNEYTDWVTTSGNYVEYYMDGKLILHLAKKSVANG
ncbi:hypothetical protein [Pelagicoccus sp. SDUM812005]|uniref:hypothetical protein n=1 Tax=Pelagicoccus sp. SDUM812005 TaxID=3041257 RepID=UPI00280FB652|nr:hypothetical protein [Pelagicoccus sp. SDUM812005]MDQ8180153.1 hypothetical protein [Pelagicoccus sp. SDUM812005]